MPEVSQPNIYPMKSHVATRTPSLAKTSSNAAMNLASRSRMKNPNEPIRPVELTPPADLAGDAGAAGPVERVERGHVRFRQGEVEEPRVRGNPLAVR